MGSIAGKKYEKRFRALGTEVAIELIQSVDREAKQIFCECESFIRSKEKILSRFLETSELSNLNQSLGAWQKASKDIIELAIKSLVWHQETNGIFDPRIVDALEQSGYRKDFRTSRPQCEHEKITVDDDSYSDPFANDLQIREDMVLFFRRMDFSGIAKGYIIDLVSSLIRNRGHRHYSVDAGGDMFLSGSDENDKPWTVLIEGVSENTLGFSLSDYAIATSGISRRKWGHGENIRHHLVHPKNPMQYSLDLRSVSVIAKTSEEADVWAKTLFLHGAKHGMAVAKQKHIAAAFLDRRGNVILSPKAKTYVSTAQ